jgi:hypothetical protein
MKRISLVLVIICIGICGLMGLAANAASSPWEQPAADLAEQVAGILGSGQARLTIRNLSNLPTDEIPAIRRLLEADMKAHGVTASGVESANLVRVTLSENQHGRLWVAEVVEGNETRVAMVQFASGSAQPAQAATGLTLRKQTLITSKEMVLAALETVGGLVAVETEEVAIYAQSAEGWREQRRIAIGQKRPLTRDPRGLILPAGDGFEAAVAGMACSGSYLPAQPGVDWTVRCREVDDPWQILRVDAGSGATPAQPGIKAFYNAARNYFTGVVTPSLGVDLPPFYTAAVLPRSEAAGLLIGGIDGKVQLLESNGLKPVSGTRDWGSDFAVLHSVCGAGAQIVVSGSGEAVTDSLRVYELPGLEAVPVSAPLALGGTVTALWPAPDGKSVFAVVRIADEYEVDRVTASCN